ncbi:MAG: phenylalanine--tRNA ligase subunit alpha [Planctomycetota bacterium JB042]
MNRELERAVERARSALSSVSTLDDLEALETRVLGRKGELTGMLRRIGTLPPEERGPFGQAANREKSALAEAVEARREELRNASLSGVRDFDPTTPGVRPARGHQHPVLAIRREIEEIFLSMGFLVLDGPEVETEHYNFEALNIPGHHPARDMQDTFWLETAPDVSFVMRTHTSPMQVRAMERFGVPIRAVVPGRVYRNETCDATHEATFHQVEGLVVDRGISVAHLKGVMGAFLGRLFGREVTVRLRPHYFPFVEPGFELDFQCVHCEGAGCSVCKRTGWIEMLGCGMVHPRVLEAGGADPEEFTGFAFGVGIDRLAMMRHVIEDIRHFHAGDLRFFEQF